MRRAFVIALAIHLCLLLGAGYIYVLPPEKREKLFEMVKIKAPPKPTARKVRIAPPKKIRKPVPMRPVKRRTAKPIQLIAARADTVPEFTINLPEPTQAVYTPEVGLVRLPEPVVTEAAESFWGKEIEMKEKEIELESFGLQNLQPVGTVENPLTQILVQIVASNCGNNNMVGVLYPEQRVIATGITGTRSMDVEVMLEPFAVPPEQVVFYLTSPNIRNRMLLSTDPEFCRRTVIGTNIFKYEWEDSPRGDYDYNDVVMIVTFMGAQGGF